MIDLVTNVRDGSGDRARMQTGIIGASSFDPKKFGW
jgi:hypothetical protein